MGKRGGGGGGYTQIKAIYVCATPKDMVLSRFSLKTGIDFDNYGLKSGLVFKETTRAAQHGDSIRLKSQKLFA